MRIAINGMGRIGRLLFRRLINDSEVNIIAVNDLMDASNMAYLLKYDSLYGTWQHDITIEDQKLKTGNKEAVVLQQPEPSQIDWSKYNIDVVLECSGRFSNKAAASKHLASGAKKVLLSTTGSSDIPLMIFGHNHSQQSLKETIVSPGGCMTNCATHVLYILNSIGIESAQINILHSYTSRQQLVDTAHNEYRRGRAAAESIIPVEIDLAQSLERLLPLQNKIAAVSIRIPVTNGALADFTVQLKHDTTKEQINELFKKASIGEYKGIIQYTEEQLVSADIRRNTHSCIVDGSLTSIVGRQLKLICWFDNEFGYTSRMIDWLRYWIKVN